MLLTAATQRFSLYDKQPRAHGPGRPNDSCATSTCETGTNSDGNTKQNAFLPASLAHSARRLNENVEEKEKN